MYGVNVAQSFFVRSDWAIHLWFVGGPFASGLWLLRILQPGQRVSGDGEDDEPNNDRADLAFVGGG